ncbi:MAG TPA: glycosyltransferase family 2 protein [Dongiaceae bacterium]|nr:glycosyltransferase family 2 protein [Dongiaceae bacterium]
MALARALGLHKTRLLVLDYPEFTLENLALLSDNYDFLIADRALHLCDSLDDAARETLRVLRPGGWFVHTTSILDLTLGLRWDTRRLTGRALRRLFGAGTAGRSCGHAAGAVVSWVVGRKADTVADAVPAVDTRERRRRWYPRAPRPVGAKLGVVGIVRNEAPYLLEWIAHYRVLGFDHIVIYDNDSNDASWRILMRLAKAREIAAVYWHVRPGVHKQASAYNDAIAKLRDSLEWCLFADLDEFLMLDEGLTIEHILPADPTVGAVAFGWRIFGSAGIRNRDLGLIIERFTKADGTNEGTIKAMVRPRDVAYMSVHFPWLARGRMVDASGNTVAPRNPAEPPLQGPARIHHYCTRSWEEFESKRARGRGGGPHGAKRDPSLFGVMDRNNVTLTDALRLVPAVRREVDRLRKIVRG